MGELFVKTEYHGQNATLPLLVVQEDGPSLVGRNWLAQIRLDWKSIFSIKDGHSLGSLLTQHSDVFREELGTVKDVKVKLYVKENCTPKFFKSRTLPLALREKVSNELDRLEASGIIVPVKLSAWAAPVVPVIKKDGNIRLCGDYKVTVNSVAQNEVYPLPRIEELFAAVAGGKIFSKLDLSHAYLQLQLDEASQEYVTINTHCGLYRYTRLPFGVTSAPPIFQRTMETLLRDLPMVAVYIDDILVITNSATSAVTIDKLRNTFATFGLSEILVTDNGSNFTSAEFEEFLKSNGIRHTRTAPYHPASNGLAERAVQSFKLGMKKLTVGSLEARVARFLFTYRITPQTTTGISPSELLLGHRLCCHLDFICPNLDSKARQSQYRQKETHDFHAQDRDFQVGDHILAKNFSSGSWNHSQKNWSCFIYS